MRSSRIKRRVRLHGVETRGHDVFANSLMGMMCKGMLPGAASHKLERRLLRKRRLNRMNESPRLVRVYVGMDTVLQRLIAPDPWAAQQRH
jgi:hypothetical protein